MTISGQKKIAQKNQHKKLGYGLVGSFVPTVTFYNLKVQKNTDAATSCRRAPWGLTGLAKAVKNNFSFCKFWMILNARNIKNLNIFVKRKLWSKIDILANNCGRKST